LLILPHKIIKKTKTAKEAFDFCSGRCLAHHGEPQCEKYNKMKYEYAAGSEQVIFVSFKF
jgi:hypothetical protein